jgi:Rad3-related DNA helicase
MQRAIDGATRAQTEDEAIDNAVPQELLQACQRFAEKLGSEVFGNKHVAAATLEFSREVLRFYCIGLLFAEHHRRLSKQALPRREIKLLCLNAFEYLQACYPHFHAVCGFSATCTPTRYFQQALGLQQDCRGIVLESPFDSARLGVCVATYIDTRYRQREQYIDNICDAIATTWRARRGNYLVFFSAYHFMQQVHERFQQRHVDIDTSLQQRDADEAAQAEFLQRFFESSPQLGFAIMGGRFAEGIDYRGDALIGAIVVGVGMPQVNTEQQLIQRDFDAMQLDGFDFAFRFPGLLRVKQSAGRVIRSEQDRGVVVLLERRFQQPVFVAHLPQHWNPVYCKDDESLQQSLRLFWGQPDGSD